MCVKRSELTSVVSDQLAIAEQEQGDCEWKNRRERRDESVS
jgi:hypothetical protein